MGWGELGGAGVVATLSTNSHPSVFPSAQTLDLVYIDISARHD